MNKKQYISFFLTVFITLSLLVLPQTVNAADLEEYDPSIAADVLKMLKVVETDYQPEQVAEVTRAEFTKVAVGLLNLNNVKMNAELPFEDVAINNSCYDSIVTAYACGLIHGNGDRTFRPSDAIAPSEAIKILTEITGYAPLAEVSGGFPTGYLAAADRAEIIQDIVLTDKLTGPDMIHLAYNTLFADQYEQKTFGSAQRQYRLKKGENILKNVFDMRQASGIVNATEHTSLSGTGTQSSDLIRIDSDIFRYTAQEAEPLLGQKVIYYYEENSGSYSVIHNLHADSAYNHVTAITEDALLRFEKNTLYYEQAETKAEVKLKLNPMMDILYNGKADTKHRLESMTLTNAALTFVDNDGDYAADVVKICSYKDYVVYSYGAKAEAVSLRFGKGNLDLNQKNTVYRMMLDGKEISGEALRDWDILSVMYSDAQDGETLCTIEVTRFPVKGTIEETSDDKIVIGGHSYSYIPSPKQLTASLGQSGTFYCNVLGKIVACNSEENFEYAYIRAISVQQGLEDEVFLKLLTQTDSAAQRKTADKVRIDGNLLSLGVDIVSCVQAGELIRYRLDANGNISCIDTLQNGSSDEDDKLSLDGSYTSLLYKSTAYEFVKEVLVNDETKIFFVPDNDAEKFYTVGSCTDLINDRKYSFQAYDMDETKVAKAILIHSTEEDRDILWTAPFAIITGVSKRNIETGDTVIGLRLSMGGISTDGFWMAEEDTALYESLKSGDIVQYDESKNEVGRVIKTRLLLNEDSRKNYFHKNILGTGTQLFCSWGKVVQMSESALLLNVDSGDSSITDPYYIKSTVPFYIYDGKKKTVQNGSFADVKIGDEVFLKENYYMVEAGFIYR